MARFQFFRSLEAFEPDLARFDLGFASTSEVRIVGRTTDGDPIRITLEGLLPSDPDGDVYGYIDEISISSRGTLLAGMTDFRLDLEAVEKAFDIGPLALFNLIFGDDDVLIGSRGADVMRFFAGDDLLRGRGGDDDLIGGRGKDRILGGSGDDRLTGGSNDDTLRGGAGADLLRGGAGADALSGGIGRDHLRGQAGNDVLVGGRGNDILSGATGRDVFVISRGDGADLIDDFQLRLDTIRIGRGASDFDDLRIEDRGRDAAVTFANVEITLSGVDASRLAADHFDF